MRQFRITTPSVSISNITSKFASDSKKEKSSTCACSIQETSKRRTNVVSATHSPTMKKKIEMRSRSSTNSISPEQAAIVVKDYIMPLLKLERETKHIRRRTETFNLQSKNPSSKNNSTISDFKLVSDLKSELDKLKEKNSNINKQLKEVNQDKESIGVDYKYLQDKLLVSESNLMFLNFINTQNSKKTQQELFGKSVANDQLLKYKLLYEDERKKNAYFCKSLSEEKAKNDKLKNVAVQLEHVNTLLIMENDIIGEKLKGLFYALSNLTGNNSNEIKIFEEFGIVKNSLCSISHNLIEIYQTVSSMHQEKQELEVLVKELGDITLGIQGRKDKYIKNLRDKIKKIDFDLKNTTNDREKLKKDLEEITQKYKDLQEEHLKLRSKIKNFKVSFSNDFLEEKYCINCQKPYHELENFNWSCKRHSSLICDDIYWCCGQKGRNAPGCMTSKHISSEEKDDKNESSDEIDPNATVLCSSCRNTGHTFLECPKDPNTRSKFDPVEELQRIENYQTKKKKLNAESYLIKKKFIQMVINKIKKITMIEDETNQENEINSDDEQFPDILNYKNQYLKYNPGNLKEIIRNL